MILRSFIAFMFFNIACLDYQYYGFITEIKFIVQSNMIATVLPSLIYINTHSDENNWDALFYHIL